MISVAHRSFATLALLVASGSTVPMPSGDLAHYVFFNRDRARIREPWFLETPAIAGAQLKYTWRELEPERGAYAFESIAQDLATLRAAGKRLVVQIQDVSFHPDSVLVPRYLTEDPAFGGGAARQYVITRDDESTATPEGWVARRWDPAVRDRFAALLGTLGAAFDGEIEGLNLAETAVEFGVTGDLYPPGFTPAAYRDAIVDIMSAARAAFVRSVVIVYANFMPGEWLPWEDRGYLRSVYAHADSLGVGVGGPDVKPFRRAQRSHSYPLIRGRAEGVPAGLAVQWGNLDEIVPGTDRKITAGELHAFARDSLRIDYLFWGVQEPHYTGAILPYLASLDD